jgi:hypothetical protein
MHGNRPQPGGADVDPTPEHRRALRRDLLAVASSTRELLADDFVVGAEISEGDGALSATVAVQPPAGSVVSAGFEYDADDAEADPRSLAHDLAAGAVLEAKHAARDVDRAAR